MDHLWYGNKAGFSTNIISFPLDPKMTSKHKCQPLAFYVTKPSPYHWYSYPSWEYSMPKKISWLKVCLPWLMDSVSNSSKSINNKGTHSVVVSLYNTHLYCNTAKTKTIRNSTAALIWWSSGWFRMFLTLYYLQSLYRWHKALDFGNKAASCLFLSMYCPQSGLNSHLLPTDSSTPFIRY